MLNESGLAASGRPLEHDGHLAVRRDGKESDFTPNLGIKWFLIDTERPDVEFSSLLHEPVSLVCLVYVVNLARWSHDKRNRG